jgi:TonB dependent receptor.
LYFFGSGLRYNTNYGGDLRNTGNVSAGRLRPNGTIVPRNNFVGDSNHRVDIRVQKRMTLHGQVSVEGFAEVFNVFNRANYGAYVTSESNARYGQPTTGSTTAGLIAYGPRAGQLGLRFAF